MQTEQEFQMISNSAQMNMRVSKKKFIELTQTQAIKNAHSSITYYPKHLGAVIKSTVLCLYCLESKRDKGSLETSRRHSKIKLNKSK